MDDVQQPLLDDLERAQADLGRALGRARAGQDSELSQRVRDGGEALARVLTSLMKLTRVHAPDNRAFDQPIAELARVVGVLHELLGAVHLVTVEDQVYVNDVRVRFDVRVAGRELGDALLRHEAGGLSFHGPLDAPAIRRLVSALAADAAPEARRAALAQRLVQAGLRTIEPEPVYRFRTGSERERPPSALDTVRRMYALAEEAFENLAAGRVMNPLALRRALVTALDTDIVSPAFWAPAPPEVPLAAAHAVEVGMLALLLARAVGFSPSYLQDLGIAALVHDAGYFAPGMDGAQDAFARHPIEGARIVLRQRGFQEGKLRRLRAVLEHHRDLRGAPTPSVTGAILRIAEDYATFVRVYGARTLRAQVLGGMLKAEALYHAPLVQLLVNALGAHPPGTLVELEDGRRARVSAPARSAAHWDKPLLDVLDPETLAPTGESADAAGGAAIRRALPG